MKKMIKCVICKEIKKYFAKGMCYQCYNKEYNRTHQKERRQYYKDHREESKKYYKDHRDEKLIYTKQYRERQIGYGGGSEMNKNCPTYLGITIAEQILSHIFKNVQIMPYGNHGYDFKCGKGYLVDVKSACFIKNYSIWSFHIRQNLIADYFLCLGFDNREDLNPLHLWLIPANDINHLTQASISESTLDKWSEYEQSLDEVLVCCNKMKGI